LKHQTQLGLNPALKKPPSDESAEKGEALRGGDTGSICSASSSLMLAAALSAAAAAAAAVGERLDQAAALVSLRAP